MVTSQVNFVSSEFPVRYAETDAMGVVHHAAYLVYFEEARSHYLRSLNRDYATIEAEGFQLPIVEVGVRYHGSLKYGQQIHIKTWVRESRSRRIKFDYEISAAGSEEVLVSGFTTHIWTDSSGKVTRAPDELLKLFSTAK